MKLLAVGNRASGTAICGRAFGDGVTFRQFREDPDLTLKEDTLTVAAVVITVRAKNGSALIAPSRLLAYKGASADTVLPYIIQTPEP